MEDFWRCQPNKGNFPDLVNRALPGRVVFITASAAERKTGLAAFDRASVNSCFPDGKSLHDNQASKQASSKEYVSEDLLTQATNYQGQSH
jgi:hypothetical protein